MFELENKKVIITGATGGIGNAITDFFCKQKSIILATGTNQQKLNLLKEKYNKINIKNFDISKHDNIENFVNEVSDILGGGPDILINNAGITKDNLLLRMKEEDWESVIATNLNSIFYLTKAIIRSMLKQKYGRIINITSVVGLIGNPGQANYAASKAGILGFTKSIARELGGKNITCNAIAPGFIETDMINTLPKEQLDTIISTVPLKRLGKPEDISNVVAFLSSDLASYITGQTIAIDGGIQM